MPIDDVQERPRHLFFFFNRQAKTGLGCQMTRHQDNGQPYTDHFPKHTHANSEKYEFKMFL
jgi:hypothetical protein